MTYLQKEIYFNMIIVALILTNYFIARYGLYKEKLLIKKPIQFSIVYTISYLLIIVFNLSYTFSKLNNVIYGYEMNWFDLGGGVLFFMLCFMMIAPVHLLLINKIFPIRAVKPIASLVILYTLNTAVLLIHQKIYSLIK